MYAISNFDEYDLNLGDLLHFVKRISMDSFELWMARNFSDSIKKIEESKSGEECKRALIDLGVTVGVIDNECNVIHTEGIDYGYEIIMSLIEAEMSEYGLSLKKLQEQVNDYDKAQSYFEKFAEIALKYHVINSPIVKNELRILRDENQPIGMTYSNPGEVDGNSMSKQEELVDKNVDVAEDD